MTDDERVEAAKRTVRSYFDGPGGELVDDQTLLFYAYNEGGYERETVIEAIAELITDEELNVFYTTLGVDDDSSEDRR